MDTKHRAIGSGIAATIAGIVSLGAGLDAAAANRPSPDIHKRPAPAVVVVEGHRPSPHANRRPKPTVVTTPCPAADNTPQCNLRAGTATTTDAAATALRSPTATGGGAATLSVGRMTPSQR
jgi:hypothetical protein